MRRNIYKNYFREVKKYYGVSSQKLNIKEFIKEEKMKTRIKLTQIYLDLTNSTLFQIFVYYLCLFLFIQFLSFTDPVYAYSEYNNSMLSKEKKEQLKMTLDKEITAIEWLKTYKKRSDLIKYLQDQPDIKKQLDVYASTKSNINKIRLQAIEALIRSHVTNFTAEKEFSKNLPTFFLFRLVNITAEDQSYCSHAYKHLTIDEQKQLINFSIKVYIKAFYMGHDIYVQEARMVKIQEDIKRIDAQFKKKRYG